MSFQEDAVAAVIAGENADLGDANPYAGQSLALAKLWQSGYQRMLTIRAAATPAMQAYLQGRAATG